ncbi:MAG: hypothetical protein AAGJ10_01970 [Bacteroidota bacterium]
MRSLSITFILVAVLFTGCDVLPDINEGLSGATVHFAAQHPLAFSMLNVPGAPNAALVPTQEDWKAYPCITHMAARPVPYPDSVALIVDHGPLVRTMAARSGGWC